VKYKLIIFDFDGTLADSYAWFVAALGRAAERYHFPQPTPSALEAMRDCHARQIMARLGIPLWKIPTVGRFMRQEMAAATGQIPLFPGVADLLPRLAGQGMRLAMVSSNTEENIRRVVGARLAGSLDIFACGASLFGKRPKLRKALKLGGCPANEALCIGDELRDLEAAHQEGMAFGAVAWGFTSAEAFARQSPDEMFYQVEEIYAKLVGR
jgi:phosphoglycolate phosphatase